MEFLNHYKIMFSKLKYEYLLFIIAVIWAFFFSFSIQLKPEFNLFGDDLSYLSAAKNLYLEHQVDEGRPMIIALINGFPLLFGFSELVVIKWSILVNFCCWFVTILFVFKIVATKLNRQKAFWFALFFLFCIGNLAIAFHVLSESVFIFMLILVVYFINKKELTKQYHFLTIAITITVLAILVRPMAIGLLLILVVFNIKNFKQICYSKYAFLLLLSLSLVFIQMYSLKKLNGDFTISYIDSFTYYNYLGAKADCLRKNIDYLPGKNERFEFFRKFSSHEQRKIANLDVKEQLSNNKVNLFKAYLFCIYSNSSKGSYIVSSCKNINQTSYFDACYFFYKAISKLQNILFTIFGILLSFYCLLKRKKESNFNVVISLFILFIIFISAISCYECDRFHIVIYPMVILLLTRFFEMKKLYEICKQE